MNYYDILGVKKDISQKELKKAYKELISQYHPDVYKGDKSFAEQKTKELNIAYDVLSKPELRKEYDMEINSQYNYTQPTYSYTPPKYNNPSSYSYENYYRNKNASEFGDYEKRYTDYHRSKTPNSNYVHQRTMHDDISDTIINTVDKMSFLKKIIIVFIMFLAYLLIFVLTLSKYNSFNSGEETGTLLNSHKNEPKENTTVTNSIVKETESSKNFNINDYFTDEELQKVYEEYVPNQEISFTEFKQLINEYCSEYDLSF